MADIGRSAALAASGCQPSASASISVESSRSGIPNADWDSVIHFIVKVKADRGWRKYGKGTSYRTEEEAVTAAEKAALNHGRARVIEQELLIRERIVRQVENA